MTMLLPLLRTRLPPITATAARCALLPGAQSSRMSRGHFAAFSTMTKDESIRRRTTTTTTVTTLPAATMSTKPTLPKLELEESAKTRIRKRVFFRFLDYLAGYGKNVLDKIIPEKAKQFYRFVGLRSGSCINFYGTFFL